MNAPRIAATALCLLTTACSASEDGDSPPAEVPAVVCESFDVRPSIQQIDIWNAEPGAELEVVGPTGEVVGGGWADDLGSLIVRELDPGAGYAVRLADAPEELTNQLTVLSMEGSLPDEEFYAGQVLQPGFGYLTVRDGTQLSVFVSLPGPVEEGPYPTIVNYSGYSPSMPGKSVGVDFLCTSYPVLCDAPDHAAGIIAGVMGYASVGVNVRGSGCSGGAYDYFDALQLTDGYDVVEIVARQEWVKHNHVGMAGLSYPGITQLFIAAQHPPSLAAITPLSVVGDTGSSTLLPGGIFNNGFALLWIEHVLNRARPYGNGWEQERVAAGDTVCENNQKLHAQKLDVIAKARANPYYSDDVARPVDPSSFVHTIDVPVFLAGQWQDEQTGPHFATLLDRFTGTDVTRFVVSNGVHPDGYAARTLMEWKSFLDLYVSLEVPYIDPAVSTIAPMFMERIFGDQLQVPDVPWAGHDDLAAARAAFEAEGALRVVFESGAAPEAKPGAPAGTFEARFDAWPVPGTQARRWYLQPGGALADTPPGDDGGGSSFMHDPSAGERGTLASGSVNPLQPDWAWPPLFEGKAVAFETEPLPETLVMIGHGSVDLWLRSTAEDADLEVGLTEVRPDGRESYVQMGWLRASHRELREDATELRPIKSHRLEDLRPLVVGEWTEVRVEIMPFVHIFRAGSRIRVSVDTPGDSMAEWRFELLEFDERPRQGVAHDAAHPSSVVLPVVPGIDVPTPLPECTALRGQPCRDHVPLVNAPLGG